MSRGATIVNMTATAHAVLGTVIAAKIGNPYLAIPLSLASHFAADMVPHWDAGINWRKKTKERLFWESAVDVLIGYVVSYLLIFLLFPTTDLLYAFFIITISQLPDWLMAPYLFLKSKFPLFKYAYTIQHKLNQTLNNPWGIINQIIVLFLAIVLAKSL